MLLELLQVVRLTATSSVGQANECSAGHGNMLHQGHLLII